MIIYDPIISTLFLSYFMYIIYIMYYIYNYVDINYYILIGGMVTKAALFEKGFPYF